MLSAQYAQGAAPDLLAPGKPAGIKAAQLNPKGVVFVGLLSAIAIAGGYLAYHNKGGSSAPAATGTSP